MLAKLIDYSIFLVLGLNFYVWGERLDWQIGNVGALQLFPLLGLIAFSTMWWHFFSAFMRRLRPELQKHEGLHKASAYWVFAAFMLHPALLVGWGMEQGLGSGLDIFRAYVGDEQMIYIWLGYLALTGFILFDIARVWGSKPLFKRHRRLITAVSDVSFGLILIHSLSIGQHLQSGWFRTYWLLLGLSGIGFILYRYYLQYYERPPARD